MKRELQMFKLLFVLHKNKGYYQNKEKTVSITEANKLGHAWVTDEDAFGGQFPKPFPFFPKRNLLETRSFENH